MSSARYTLLFILLIGVVSCSARNTSQPSHLALSTQNTSPAEEQHDSAEAVESAESESTSYTPLAEPVQAYRGDYIIGSEDVLEISVYQVDELDRDLRVSSTGYIKMPLIGAIKAAGLTTAELESELMSKYMKYLQEPLVSVFIKEYKSQRITVLGAVKSPKVHIVRNQNFLLDMLSLSGGLMNNAGDICYVRRGTETVVINIKDLLVKGNISLNVAVFAGDVIHIPVGGTLFVDGAVRSPGSFPMKGKTTLTQAISMARGLDSVAIPSGIKVFRDTGKERREVIPVDYNSIISEKTPDFVLTDNDIVIVPKSTIKEFIRSISGAVSIGKASLSGGL